MSKKNAAQSETSIGFARWPTSWGLIQEMYTNRWKRSLVGSLFSYGSGLRIVLDSLLDTKWNFKWSFGSRLLLIALYCWACSPKQHVLVEVLNTHDSLNHSSSFMLMSLYWWMVFDRLMDKTSAQSDLLIFLFMLGWVPFVITHPFSANIIIAILGARLEHYVNRPYGVFLYASKENNGTPFFYTKSIPHLAVTQHCKCA